MWGRVMIDWDDAFDNSGYVSGSADLPDAWLKAASDARQALTGQLDVRYGPHPRAVFDLFEPKGAAHGSIVFVHGGYWHLMDKSYWSHLARGWVQAGWRVVIPSYPLAPEVRISEITRSIADAVEHVVKHSDGPIRLVGHSAGGHLVARMGCVGVLPASVQSRIAKIVGVSGVYHLDPLLQTAMNNSLGLSASEVAAESPVHLAPLTHVPMTFWVGDQERPEFVRQTRMIAERWTALGAKIQTVYAQGKHHFNVLDDLTAPNGDLTRHCIS